MKIPDPNICTVCGKPFEKGDTVQSFASIRGGVPTSGTVHVECAGVLTAPTGPAESVTVIREGIGAERRGKDYVDIGLRLPPSLLAEIDRRTTPTKGGKGRSSVVVRMLERYFQMCRETLPELRVVFNVRERKAIAALFIGTSPKGEVVLQTQALAACREFGVDPVELSGKLSSLSRAQYYTLWDALDRLATQTHPQFDTLLDDVEPGGIRPDDNDTTPAGEQGEGKEE